METQALASVKPPNITYQLHLPRHIVEDGLLSNAQLEALTYACQAHETRLASGARRGFLLGDGTGVGKGRTLAGAVLESWRRADRKEGGSHLALWVSVNDDLATDAARDIAALRAADIPVWRLKNFTATTVLKEASPALKKKAYVDDFIRDRPKEERMMMGCASLEGDYEYDPAEWNRPPPPPPPPAAPPAPAASPLTVISSAGGDSDETEDEGTGGPFGVSTHEFAAKGKPLVVEGRGKVLGAAKQAVVASSSASSSAAVVALRPPVQPTKPLPDPTSGAGLRKGILFLTYALLSREDLTPEEMAEGAGGGAAAAPYGAYAYGGGGGAAAAAPYGGAAYGGGGRAG